MYLQHSGYVKYKCELWAAESRTKIDLENCQKRYGTNGSVKTGQPENRGTPVRNQRFIELKNHINHQHRSWCFVQHSARKVLLQRESVPIRVVIVISPYLSCKLMELLSFNSSESKRKTRSKYLPISPGWLFVGDVNSGKWQRIYVPQHSGNIYIKCITKPTKYIGRKVFSTLYCIQTVLSSDLHQRESEQ